FLADLEELLEHNGHQPRRDRLLRRPNICPAPSVTAHRVIAAGITEAKATEAFIPLTFAPAEAYQFDWSEEWIVLDGIAFKAQVAHARLCHSRMPYIRAYPRQSQEMMFDAHARAFAFWGGACERGIYDNMKT